MHTLTRLTLALAACVIALPAIAAERSSLAAATTNLATATRPQLALASTTLPAAAAPTVGLTPKAMGSVADSGTPMANPLRAYPPSCAAYPLPTKASGASTSARVPLLATNTSGQQFTETVTVTVWRMPCSSSGSKPRYNPAGSHSAMTLLRIDRDAENEGELTRWTYFPLVQAAQGSITDLNTDPKTLLRVALEPNTVISEFPRGMGLINSTTFVLENYATAGAGYFTFSDAFTLRINPGLRGVAPLDLAIPAYRPTPETYPAAFAPRALDGYAAAQWVSEDAGLLVQVSEQYDSSGQMTRQLIFDLNTADLNGDPLWLVGNAAFAVGATSLDMDTIYLGPGLSHQPWGKVNIKMPSCGALEVTFTPNADLPSPIPGFSGLTTFGRLFDANGMVCE